MPVPAFLNTIEQSGLSTWIRQTDSIFGFYFILVFHTIGMALVVGPNAVVDFILLGWVSDIPLAPFKRWFTVMWIGFWINAVSGLFLLIAYPTKAFTNPVFYVKLSLIALALWTMQSLKTRMFGDARLSPAAIMARCRALALCSLIFWTGAITTGRLLAYTFRYISYGVPKG